MVNPSDVCVSIIGGSSEIGCVVSSSLRNKGFNVICSYFSGMEHSVHDGWLHCDVTSNESINEYTKQVLPKSKQHVIVYLSGISKEGMTHRLSEADWSLTLNINLSGAYRVAKSFLPYMRQVEWGRFLFAGSVTPRIGVPGTSSYSASKAGLVGLSKTIAVENAQKGITSNCLEIGYMDAGMTYTIPEDFLEGLRETIPTGRFGAPSGIADAVAYLIDAQDVTGSVLSITGGL